jgi:hypothetical protein
MHVCQLLLASRAEDNRDIASLRQQTTLARYVAVELKIRANHNRLVRSNSHADRYVGNAIETRTARRRHHPIDVARVPCSERYGRASGLAGIRARWAGAGDRHTG